MRFSQATGKHSEHAGPLLHPLGRPSSVSRDLPAAIRQPVARVWPGENRIKAPAAVRTLNAMIWRVRKEHPEPSAVWPGAFLVSAREPWFVAPDVCRALEISNPTVALDRLDDDEKMTLRSTEGHAGQRGGAQSFNIVNEPGLYALVLGSRKPEAKTFKQWITHEVILAARQ